MSGEKDPFLEQVAQEPWSATHADILRQKFSAAAAEYLTANRSFFNNLWINFHPEMSGKPKLQELCSTKPYLRFDQLQEQAIRIDTLSKSVDINTVFRKLHSDPAYNNSPQHTQDMQSIQDNYAQLDILRDEVLPDIVEVYITGRDQGMSHQELIG